jgi:hypothetical protein
VIGAGFFSIVSPVHHTQTKATRRWLSYTTLSL